MKPYCGPKDITDLILSKVAEAAERLNPGLVERAITAVTGEVSNLLVPRYPQPFDPVPAIIRGITAVIAAWRVVGAITSLMDTEASSDNQWLPLQTQYKQAYALLLDLAHGKTKLDCAAEEEAAAEEQSIAVAAPEPFFDLRGF